MSLSWFLRAMQAECIQHGLRTIAFCMTRKLCELVMAYTRETLKATAPHLAGSLSVYRAGYSPQARRRETSAFTLYSGRQPLASYGRFDRCMRHCTSGLVPGSEKSLGQSVPGRRRREK